MLIGPFSPNILSGHFGHKIGSRTFIPLLEALKETENDIKLLVLSRVSFLVTDKFS